MSQTYGTDDARSGGNYGEVSPSWGWAIVRGVFAIIFGILLLTWPQATVIVFTYIFAIYLIVDGIVEIVSSIRSRSWDPAWGWVLTLGILSVLAGLVALFFPLFTGGFLIAFLLWIVAIWAVIGGIFGIPAAASLATGGTRVAGILLAILSIILGILLIWLLIANPANALIGFVWVVAVYAIVVGVILIIAGIVRGATGRRKAPATAAA